MPQPWGGFIASLRHGVPLALPTGAWAEAAWRLFLSCYKY